MSKNKINDDRVLVHSLTYRPESNRKLQIKWVEGQDECTLVFKRMLRKGEKPETSTCYTEHRLGAKFSGIHLSDEVIPDIIAGLSQYLKEKNE